MGKVFIPKATSLGASGTSSATSGGGIGMGGGGGDHQTSRVLPMPGRIGVFLDYEAGRVAFYDADSMRMLYERQVDCSGTMYPAFGLMGSGAVHLEEVITSKRLTYM